MYLYIVLLPLTAYILNLRIKNLKKAYQDKRNLKMEIFLLSITLLIILLLVYLIGQKTNNMA